MDRQARRLCLWLLVPAVGLVGCAATRPASDQAVLLQQRQALNEKLAAQGRQIMDRLVERAKAEYDAYAAGAKSVPAVDVLIVSGGGDWGAFGAGYLKGWGQVQGPMARPQFDAVTGVSTGALMAPFAYLGDEQSIERINHLYRNPQKDWVRPRGLLFFLPSNLSFATIPGLEREMRKAVDRAMLEQIAAQGRTGRMLLVNTTNVDDSDMRVWDVAAEAQRAVETGDINRVQQILLASAGIPGAFPARLIDGNLYVDGGVTGNILYGGRAREDQSLPALWTKAYPDLKIPAVRYWVIFNNQFLPPPRVVQPTWPPIVSQSVSIATRSATLTSLRHLFAQAEISRLKRGAVIEVRVVAIPNDWTPPKPGHSRRRPWTTWLTSESGWGPTHTHGEPSRHDGQRRAGAHAV